MENVVVQCVCTTLVVVGTKYHETHNKLVVRWRGVVQQQEHTLLIEKKTRLENYKFDFPYQKLTI